MWTGTTAEIGQNKRSGFLFTDIMKRAFEDMLDPKTKWGLTLNTCSKEQMCNLKIIRNE